MNGRVFSERGIRTFYRMEKEAPDWFLFTGSDKIDTPVLVIYPERVQQNIDTAIAMVGGPARLRPHAKTHKSPDLTRMLLASGITAFKCSTIAEAEMLAKEGVPDILLAYQPVGPKVDRLLQLIQRYPSTLFSCLVDNHLPAIAIAGKARKQGLTVQLYMDLDVGMHRTGITPGEQAVALYRTLSKEQGISMRGLHAYDGHISDPDPEVRAGRVQDAFASVWDMQQTLQQNGIPAVQLIAGGMPSFPILSNYPDLVCSPGTFVYWDKSYTDKISDTNFLPAALVLSRVISKPGPNRLTLDLGHKSIASENSLDKRVHWLNKAGLVPVGHSEEHFFYETGETVSGEIGELLFGMPYHICPTVALYEKAITVDGGKISGEWRTVARNRQLEI